MPAFNKFHSFVAARNNGVHNLGSHALKVMFTNVAPVVSNTVRANLTEIAAGGGYPAGGLPVVVTASGQIGGVYKLEVDDIVLTPTGPIGPFRYAVLYNDTPTSPADPLIGWWDYGQSITPGVGEPFTIDFSAVNGALQDS
ncbi:MAG: hypothetical protein ING24_09095 [Roseomonas sp.]|nr:hypothetical protein [Roseomonas sp.]